MSFSNNQIPSPTASKVSCTLVISAVMVLVAGCSEVGDAVASPASAGVQILPDGITFRATDGTNYVCAVEPGTSFPILIGRPVPLSFDPTLSFAGLMTVQPLSIRLNPTRLNAMTPATQKFLFAHECGHVNSGDLSQATAEISANCWGARRLRRQQLLSQSEWDQVCAYVTSLAPFASPPYPSGSEQWLLLQDPSCF